MLIHPNGLVGRRGDVPGDERTDQHRGDETDADEPQRAGDGRGNLLAVFVAGGAVVWLYRGRITTEFAALHTKLDALIAKTPKVP